MGQTDLASALLQELLVAGAQGHLRFFAVNADSLSFQLARLESGAQLLRVLQGDSAFVDIRVERCDSCHVVGAGVPFPSDQAYAILMRDWHPTLSVWEVARTDWVSRLLPIEVLVGCLAVASSPVRFQKAFNIEEPKQITCWSADLLGRKQDPNWCLPTCMSILGSRFDPQLSEDPKYFAKAWGQHDGDPFVSDKMGQDLAHLCATHGLKIHSYGERASHFANTRNPVVQEQDQELLFREICKIGKPFILATDSHATIVTSATEAAFESSGQSVLACEWIDPEDGRKRWLAYRDSSSALLDYMIVAAN